MLVGSRSVCLWIAVDDGEIRRPDCTGVIGPCRENTILRMKKGKRVHTPCGMCAYPWYGTEWKQTVCACVEYHSSIALVCTPYVHTKYGEHIPTNTYTYGVLRTEHTS